MQVSIVGEGSPARPGQIPHPRAAGGRPCQLPLQKSGSRGHRHLL